LLNKQAKQKRIFKERHWVEKMSALNFIFSFLYIIKQLL